MVRGNHIGDSYTQHVCYDIDAKGPHMGLRESDMVEMETWIAICGLPTWWDRTATSGSSGTRTTTLGNHYSVKRPNILIDNQRDSSNLWNPNLKSPISVGPY